MFHSIVSIFISISSQTEMECARKHSARQRKRPRMEQVNATLHDNCWQQKENLTKEFLLLFGSSFEVEGVYAGTEWPISVRCRSIFVG